MRALEPAVPVQRYEYTRPGGLVHLDIKKLGRTGRIGHRITGDRRARVRGIGWEYVHVAVDDATRLAYVDVLPDEQGVTVTAFLWRALAWYRRLGIRLCRLLDDGSGYLSRVFARCCRSARVRHLRTRPYTPQTNGKAERFIQTLLREWGLHPRVPNGGAAPGGPAALAPLLQCPTDSCPSARSSAHQPPVVRECGRSRETPQTMRPRGHPA
jgi:transposase InsO family protein